MNCSWWIPDLRHSCCCLAAMKSTRIVERVVDSISTVIRSEELHGSTSQLSIPLGDTAVEVFDNNSDTFEEVVTLLLMSAVVEDDGWEEGEVEMLLGYM